MKYRETGVIVGGVIFGVLCLVAGWLLFSAMSAKSEAAEERNMNYQALANIYKADVFPNETNIQQIAKDKEQLAEWVVVASNLLHRGDIDVVKRTPAGFKQRLQEVVRKLSAYPGTAAGGRITTPDFYFGFDRYLGQSDSLPASEHVDGLAYQLAVIEMLCKELYAAEIMELKAVTRETFDIGSGAVEEDRSQTRRRRRRDGGAQEQSVSGAAEELSHGYFTRQRFKFEFVARPPAFVEVLNRLAALQSVVVVAEVELRKVGDLLSLKHGERKEARSDSGEEKDPATMTHVERIVTDPEREPPVSVKLDIDVYNFEGV